MASLLDDLPDKENNPEATIEVSASGPTIAAGEVRKRRGRPPGSKNRPKQDDTLSSSMENAIRGVFAIASLIAGWFGYEQTEELTESEAKEGARSFTPLANKLPWLADFAIWLGAPVWLIVTLRKKMHRKGTNANPPTGGDTGSNGGPITTAPIVATSNDSRETLGKVSSG